jgi:hypothetical protein
MNLLIPGTNFERVKRQFYAELCFFVKINVEKSNNLVTTKADLLKLQ